METVRDIYIDAIKYNYYSLQLLIDFLVKERGKLKMTDDANKIYSFLQLDDKYSKLLNEYLIRYEVKRNEQIRTTNNQTSHRHVG
jgi:hypothetical protein